MSTIEAMTANANTNKTINTKIQWRDKQLDLSTPKVMGILNVTPDSFSDGGRFNSVNAALSHVQQMIADGVDIIDIGGESTRPNAPAVDTDTELERVIPVVTAIRQHFGDELWLSIDTSNPTVMTQAIAAGADIINDVRALRRAGTAQAVAELGCPVVLMHSRGEPDTMNDLADYTDVLGQIIGELERDIDQAIQAGVERDKIIMDIGMGFAKNFTHHQIIMRNLDKFIEHFGLPMLFGVSRKRFLGKLLVNSGIQGRQNHQAADRDVIGAGMSLLAAQMGASIIRVHDVAKTAEMLSMWRQIYLDNDLDS
ncbi:dihydropteroate synthase [Moraxella sp. ZJ142]|uniref:dihydropteroate synthase n=1 Tax=Moraxella marmotae TaxID=3344520 RepID=UPI0035D4BC70